MDMELPEIAHHDPAGVSVVGQVARVAAGLLIRGQDRAVGLFAASPQVNICALLLDEDADCGEFWNSIILDVMDKVDSGSTHLDLVMVEQDFHHRMKAVEAKNGKRYEVQYADLSDIYNEKVPGEDIYLKDKMLEENLELVTTYDADGRARQYAFPWMKSFCSIVVNKDVIPATGEWKEGK